MKKLLQLAKDSIKEQWSDTSVCDLESYKEFSQSGGVFVTLTLNKKLRGCIGRIVSQDPIYITIFKMAKRAAFNDHRFPPLTLKEFENIEIEVSLLSQPQRIKSIDDIIIGTHGVILDYQQYSSVFLPKIALEQGWSKNMLLQQLAVKAGLRPQEWRKRATYFYSRDY